MPRWLVVGLDSGVPWPATASRVQFRGRELILRPETVELAPSVVYQYHDDTPAGLDDALRFARSFLSALAWVEDGSLAEIMVTGGGHPINVGKVANVRMVNPKFRLDYLPEPADARARLALAFYREALTVNSIPYKFLGFFKILNVLNRTGPEQRAWINRTIDALTDHFARARLAELRRQSVDIGSYLFESGRCAVAHAFSEPLVDPDDPADIGRLQADLPVIKALAQHLIEHELGIRSLSTVWREHLYELDGFRAILGAEIAAQLKGRRGVAIDTLPRLPRVSIRLRDHGPFAAFEGLPSRVLEVREGGLLLECASEGGIVKAGLYLDFADEHLHFDPVDGVAICDDGSSTAARRAAERIRFTKGLFLNGVLEVWDGDRGVLLGRTDPYIPENIDLGATVDNLDRIAGELEAEADRRAGVGS